MATFSHTNKIYDWRQDTPFWNQSRQKGRKMQNEEDPPNWIPPSPQLYRVRTGSVEGKAKSKERVSRPKTAPSLCSPLSQAVNSMYLPPPRMSTCYPDYVHSNKHPNIENEDSMLEITQLQDQRLVTTQSRDQLLYPAHDNIIIQHPVRICEITSGLY